MTHRNRQVAVHSSANEGTIQDGTAKRLVIKKNLVTIFMPKANPQDLKAIVYLHVTHGDGRGVLKQCRVIDTDNFALVAIEPRSWNDSLTPWKCPGLLANDQPFAGQATEQLHILEHDIIPYAESLLPSQPQQHIIAGYSLAGLFATWAVFNSTAFTGIASASGSLWYPNFADYVAQHALKSPLTCAYFSLGSKESKTPNQFLRNVAQETQDIVKTFRAKGIPTVFEQNPGNHFKEPELRMAKGIRHILQSS